MFTFVLPFDRPPDTVPVDVGNQTKKYQIKLTGSSRNDEVLGAPAVRRDTDSLMEWQRHSTRV